MSILVVSTMIASSYLDGCCICHASSSDWRHNPIRYSFDIVAVVDAAVELSGGANVAVAVLVAAIPVMRYSDTMKTTTIVTSVATFAVPALFPFLFVCAWRPLSHHVSTSIRPVTVYSYWLYLGMLVAWPHLISSFSQVGVHHSSIYHRTRWFVCRFSEWVLC